MSATERVLDSYPGDCPAVLEILADDPLGPASDGDDDDEGVRDHAKGEVGSRAPGGNAMLKGLAQELEVAARVLLDQVGESSV